MSHQLRDRIGTPEIAHRVTSPEHYVDWARTAHVGLGGKASDVRESGLTLDAYVSDGRWVVQCPCGNGPSAHPEWKIAVCVECGAIHRVGMPRDHRAAEAVLLARAHPHERHWFPTDETARRHGLERRETVSSLRRENRARGVPPARTD